jgi:LysB family phage lysis regulatory protein
MGIKTKLIIGALIALIITGLCGVISWQYQANAQHIKEKAEKTQLAEQRLLTIRTMESNYKLQAESLQALAKEQRDITTGFNQRDQQIQRLQHENQQYKNWAATHLPTSVKRLRTRPAITGSSEYRQWLSHSNPLLPASSAARTERRPDH